MVLAAGSVTGISGQRYYSVGSIRRMSKIYNKYVKIYVNICENIWQIVETFENIENYENVWKYKDQYGNI